MSRNKFRKREKYLHCCDNTNLDETNKWIKLRPLIEAVNEELQKFGIFSSELSIDEQMLPYFGRHSWKMFIRNKAFLSFLLKYTKFTAFHIFHISLLLGPSVHKSYHTFVAIYWQASAKWKKNKDSLSNFPKIQMAIIFQIYIFQCKKDKNLLG